MFQPTVLFEDNHLLVINKPAGIATAGVTDVPSIYSWAGAYIKKRYQKPGNVFVGIVSRLDTMTSGVLVLARTSKAAARLSDQIRQHKISKKYIAVLENKLNATDAGLWTDQLYKDDAGYRMRAIREGVQTVGSAKPQIAELTITPHKQFQVSNHWATWASVNLLTGRKHQIRVQSANRQHVVWGDKKYGAKTKELIDSDGNRGIALHAYAIRFKHPTKDERLTFTTPPPATWNIFGQIPTTELQKSLSPENWP